MLLRELYKHIFTREGLCHTVALFIYRVNTTFEKYFQKLSVQQEVLSPILMVLVKCVRSNSIERRYIRSVLLPPLRDVQNRPEVGNELRNQLCRMLTTPAIQVRDLTAELLFVVCKENGKLMMLKTDFSDDFNDKFVQLVV